jgi:hypothetical protein
MRPRPRVTLLVEPFYVTPCRCRRRHGEYPDQHVVEIHVLPLNHPARIARERDIPIQERRIGVKVVEKDSRVTLEEHVRPRHVDAEVVPFVVCIREGCCREDEPGTIDYFLASLYGSARTFTS